MILNVSSQDEPTGRSNQIGITNEGRRLPQAEIHRMALEAEKYRDEVKSWRINVLMRRSTKTTRRMRPTLR